MPDLEQRLLALGNEIDYPPTPRLANSVRRQLTVTVKQPRFDARRLAIAAVLLIVTAAALLAIPTTRNAIAGFFGLKGVIIQRVPSFRSPSPSSASDPGTRLGLGRRVTLGEAQAGLPYGITFPQALGSPDEVFLIQPPEQKAVALVWLPRPDLPAAAETGVGALVIEAPGQAQRDLFLKMLGPDASLEQLSVNGNPGYWISGKPHGFFFLDPKGQPVEDTFRLAGNALIWNQGMLVVRIESALDRDQALHYAATMQ